MYSVKAIPKINSYVQVCTNESAKCQRFTKSRCLIVLDTFENTFSIQKYGARLILVFLLFKGEQGSKSILDPCVYWQNTSPF